jgi:hypothetical protein
LAFALRRVLRADFFALGADLRFAFFAFLAFFAITLLLLVLGGCRDFVRILRWPAFGLRPKTRYSRAVSSVAISAIANCSTRNIVVAIFLASDQTTGSFAQFEDCCVDNKPDSCVIIIGQGQAATAVRLINRGQAFDAVLLKQISSVFTASRETRFG